MGVLIDTKLHFHQQVDNIFSQAIRLLGLIRNVTFLCSSPHSLLTLYSTLVRPKPLFRGILSLLRMLVCWSAYSDNLYLFVIIAFPVTYTTAMEMF